MSVVTASDAVTHDLHGSQFHSYVAPSRGSTQLCAWRTELAPKSVGTAHAVSHEEVFLVLAGHPSVSLNGIDVDPDPGDVVFVPAGATVRVDNPGNDAATLWVTTSVGLTATTGDGTSLSPPWTN